ncbi:cytidine deaminase [Hoylesella loescheii]|uniref:cytidine deaminase n=1 Tax=Hoylesella loescheii TaxID=840 RepID=UPI0026EB2901|nr:cytidine deaminase [Hoylesella loescheii]
MKTIDLNIRIREFTFDEMPEADRQLLEQAKLATYNAYANYSRFYVGAALLLDDGRVVIGANQENAAFPSGLCAERSAVFAAQSQCPEQSINTLAVAARNENGFLTEPISPCGACRQVVLEMEDRYKHPVRILLYGESRVFELSSIKDLLPLSFVDAHMHG